MDKEKLIQPANAYLRGEATEAEKLELHHWYNEASEGGEEEVMVPKNETAEQIGERIFTSVQYKIKKT